MKAYQSQFTINPYDTLPFLQQQVEALPEEQKTALIMQLAQQYYRQGRSFEELQANFQRLSKQHDRALHRIACMQTTLERLQPLEESEED